MFPSFKSKQDRENKRRALLEKYNRELQDDAAKREAYATTLWASDQEKNVISLLAKSRTTSGTQTDGSSSPSSGTQTDGSSSSSSGTQTNGSSSASSGTQTNDSSSSSSGTQTNDSTSSMGTHASGNDDIGEEEDSMSDIDDTEYEQKMQLSSHKWLVQMYQDNPELATAGYNVIRLKKDIPDENYFLGKDAIVYRKLGTTFNKKGQRQQKARSDIAASVDWVKTSEHVENMINSHSGRVNLEVDGMKAEDRDAPYINYLKRKPRGQKRGMVEKIPRLEFVPMETDTGDEQLAAYKELFDMYSAHKNDFDNLGINLIDSERRMIDGYVLKLNKSGDNLIIVKVDPNGNSSKLHHNPNIAKRVSWLYTLQYVLERFKNIKPNTPGGVADSRPSAERLLNTRTPRAWRERADHSVETGTSAQANTEAHSMRLIEQIHKQMPWIDTLDIKPVQDNAISKTYKFGDNMELYYITSGKRVSGEKKILKAYKLINWSLTLERIFETLANYHDMLNEVMIDKDIDLKHSAPEEFKRMATRQKEIEVVLHQAGITIPSNAHHFNNADVNAFATNDYITRNTEGYKGKGLGGKIVGRGLMGAGVAKATSLRGYSYTSKNLRSIQGSGSASDLKYKQLGSKFIRITDLRLDQPRLKLVYPNRTQVGRLINISKPLAKCLEHLAFEQDVNQQMYNKLTVSDKQIVHDLLRLCHLDTTFLNPITDPMEQLQAEFDKLRSHVMLGNDNPDNIRELKTLSLDLYNNRLIDENQMRQILNL